MDKKRFNVSLHRSHVKNIVKSYTDKGVNLDKLLNRNSTIFPEFATDVLAAVYKKPGPWQKYTKFFDEIIENRSLFEPPKHQKLTETVWKFGSAPAHSSSVPDHSSSVPAHSSSVPDHSSSVPDHSSSVPDPLRLTGGLVNAPGPVPLILPNNAGVVYQWFPVQVTPQVSGKI
jgi:hypothetical protein